MPATVAVHRSQGALGPGLFVCRGALRRGRHGAPSPEGVISPPRRRLDAELVRRGLVSTRKQAQLAVETGRVVVSGAIAARPSRMVAPSEPIEVIGAGPRFASRGGDKLDAALDRFAIPVVGRRALDAGASTGGFTDCLLQRGARQVVAVDVGYGQLDLRVRRDPRVVVLERTNVRFLTPEILPGGPVDLVCADLSFISLRTVAATLVELTRTDVDSNLVVLVKPQFEAGRIEASRGRGVIRDPDIWARVLNEVRTSFSYCGAPMVGLMVSPLVGPAGNVEFLAHLRPKTTLLPATGVIDVDVDAVVAEAASGLGC